MFLLLLVCGLFGAGHGLDMVDLFVNGEHYDITYPCYRQPALISASVDGSVLLAFAEGRNLSLSQCAPPLHKDSNEIGGLVLRRSLDAGSTWSAPKTIYSGNIDFYTIVYDSDTQTLWLMLQRLISVLVFSSKNQGLSWSAPVPLSATPIKPYRVLSPAVGHGIQIRSDLCNSPKGCAEAGRLVMPFVCTNGSAHGDAGQCEACHACMLLSDDHGASWYFGGYGQAGSRESQVAQIPTNSSNASLYVTERNFGPKPGHRMYARSSDGGLTLSDFGIDPALPTPVTAHWTGIVASVLSVPTRTRGKLVRDNEQAQAQTMVDSAHSDTISHFAAPPPQMLLYTAPSDPTARKTLTARISHDGGHTWPGSKVIDSGLAGYTDLALIPAGVGMIVENGAATFSDKISFVALPYAWLPQ
eukprot:m.238346 g.238346  ORF g.238346 m.238346 type:complete len:414 (+) comp21733_c1_seq1:25-1266(+)